MQAILREAAKDGRKEDIIELLKDGCDVNSADVVSHVNKLCVHVHV